jgi:hypothetical protein
MSSAPRRLALRPRSSAAILALSVAAALGGCAATRAASTPDEAAGEQRTVTFSEAVTAFDDELRDLEAVRRTATAEEIDVRIRAALRALATALERLPGVELDLLVLAASDIRDVEALMAVEPGPSLGDLGGLREALDVAAAVLVRAARGPYAAEREVLDEAVELEAALQRTAAPADIRDHALAALLEADDVLRAIRATPEARQAEAAQR